MHPHPHRIRARFHHGDEARTSHPRAQCGQRHADGGRMMSEIIIEGDPMIPAPYLKAAFYALELRQRLDASRHWHADVMRSRQRSQRIKYIVRAQLRPVRLAREHAVSQYFKA